MGHHGLGAKIKKSLIHYQPMSVDSEIILEASKKGRSSGAKSTVAKDKSGHDVHPMQSIYLGSDRRYNQYWIFLGPCDLIDPGHRQVYFESSEDGHWEVINTTQVVPSCFSVNQLILLPSVIHLEVKLPSFLLSLNYCRLWMLYCQL